MDNNRAVWYTGFEDAREARGSRAYGGKPTGSLCNLALGLGKDVNMAKFHYAIAADGGVQVLAHGMPYAEAYGSYQLRTRDGKMWESGRIPFPQHRTNNQAEYQALIEALTELQKRIRAGGGDTKRFGVTIVLDSQLVVNQVNGAWKCKDSRLHSLRNGVHNLLNGFGAWEIWYTGRKNIADVLKETNND